MQVTTGQCLSVARLSRPIGCFPTQSYGRTDDGRAIYVRYRHGHLTVQVARDTVEHGVHGPETFAFDDGSGNGCVEDLDEWRNMLSPAMDLPAVFGAYDPRDNPEI